MQQPFDISSFRQTAPYINTHRGRTFVILCSGEFLNDARFSSFIHDLALLHLLGIKIVLVHGARVQIEDQLGKGNRSQFKNDIRITDAETLETIKKAVGALRIEVEAMFSVGLINTQMSGMQLKVVSGNFVRAKPVGVKDGIDHQYTGVVRSIQVDAIQSYLQQNNIVLLSPIGYSPSGEVFNLSVIDVALSAAVSLQSDKLILMLDGANLKDHKHQNIKHLTVTQTREFLKKKKKLSLQARQFLEAATQACLNNVNRVHIIDRNIEGGLLKELFTRHGEGMLITSALYDDIRKARINDIGGIFTLIEPLQKKGILVERSREQIEVDIHRYEVIERDGMILACVALHPYVDEKVAEIACLAVHPEYQGLGLGRKLLAHIEKKALAENITGVFVLTTQTSHWFKEQGFVSCTLRELPVTRQHLYNYQRNSKIYLKDVGDM